MLFFLRRYLSALNTRKAWLLLVVIPPLLYIGWASSRHDLYLVSQSFAIVGDPPIAASDNPVTFLPLSGITAQPETLFIDRFSTTQIKKRLALSGIMPAWIEADEFGLDRFLADVMEVALTSDGVLEISYAGDSGEVGRTLVDFYSQRLLIRAAEGNARARRDMLRTGAVSDDSAPAGDATTEDSATRIELGGPLTVTAKSATWNLAKLIPAVVLLALSLLVFLIAVAVSELLDPSFKSDRQIARYLGIPVLGNIIDTDQLRKHMKAGSAKPGN